MAEDVITVEEQHESRSGDSTYEERRYTIEGTEDKTLARAAMLEFAPATVPGDGGEEEFEREDSKASVENATDLKDGWYGTVRWKKPSLIAPPTGGGGTGLISSFDTTGGTLRRLQALASIKTYMKDPIFGGQTEVANPFGGLIGVNPDGSVDGTDIPSRVWTWEETKEVPNDDVDLAYLRLLFVLSGTVNSVDYRIYEPGENLFLGARGSRQGNGGWTITFFHAASPNVTDLTIGEFTGIAKRGWDYLWVYYSEVENVTQKMILPKGHFVNIDQVLPYDDHNQLDS